MTKINDALDKLIITKENTLIEASSISALAVVELYRTRQKELEKDNKKFLGTTLFFMGTTFMLLLEIL